MEENREDALRRALGKNHPNANQRVDQQVKGSSLRKGKVVGPGWMGGIFQTRLNWGVLVMIVGVILFIVWLVVKSQNGG